MQAKLGPAPVCIDIRGVVDLEAHPPHRCRLRSHLRSLQNPTHIHPLPRRPRRPLPLITVTVSVAHHHNHQALLLLLLRCRMTARKERAYWLTEEKEEGRCEVQHVVQHEQPSSETTELSSELRIRLRGWRWSACFFGGDWMNSRKYCAQIELELEKI